MTRSERYKHDFCPTAAKTPRLLIPQPRKNRHFSQQTAHWDRLYLVAHNLLRCIIAESVARHEIDLERVSFKGTVDALRQYCAAMAQARSRKKRRELWDDLLLNLARDQVPLRPGRREPRALKRRPKRYALLTKPRHRFKEPLSYDRWIRAQKSKGLK